MSIRWKNSVLTAVVLVLFGITWAAAELWWPRSTNLRQFDPDDVARLETQMWARG